MIDEVRRRAATIEHEWDARSLDWPLDETSVVVEVGGYTGRWALQMAERYHPRLFVFEPQGWAADVCKQVLGAQAIVVDYGLGTRNVTDLMGAWGTDGCSFVRPGDGHEGQMVEIGFAFQAFGIDHIDLMLMNIEGYEYTLIPHMLDRGIYPQRLMVQLHPPEVDDGATERVYLQLADAHYRVVWTYGIVLTAWERT